MSNCHLDIEFDRQPPVYRGGERVAGMVRVHVEGKDAACRDLRIERRWSTRGGGNTDRGQRVGASVFKGEWQAGRTYEYPFSFTAPATPLTYQGERFNIAHEVEARADIPWSTDARARGEYVVAPGGSGGKREAEIVRPQESATFDFGKPGLTTGIGAALIALGLFTFGVCTFVLVPIGAVMVFFSMRNKIAEQRIGRIHVTPDSTVLRPGRDVGVRVRFTPNFDTELNGIYATLRATEHTITGHGKNRETHKEILHEETFELAGGDRLSAGRETAYAGRLTVPDSQAFSFAARSHRVAWELIVHIDIPQWPDWTNTTPMVLSGDAPPGEADAAPIPIAEPRRQAAAPQTKTAPPASPPKKTAKAKKTSKPETTKTSGSPFGTETLPQQPDMSEAPPIAAAGAAAAAAGLSAATAATAQRDPMEELAELPVIDKPDTTLRAPTALQPPAPPDSNLPEPHQSVPFKFPEPHEPSEQGATDAPAADTEATESEQAPPPPPSGGLDAAGLIEAMDRIEKADRFNGDKQRFAEALIDRACALELTVRSVSTTFDYGGDEAYRNGRTVVGSFGEGHQPIAVRFPHAQNEAVSKLKTGSTHPIRGRIVSWSTLHRRAEVAAE